MESSKMGTMIMNNVVTKAVNVAGLMTDERQLRWVQNVTAINEKYENGDMYVGKYLQNGTIRLEHKRHTLIVCVAPRAVGASRYRYRTKHYAVVHISPQGRIVATTCKTTGDKPGWALRLLPYIKKELDRE